MHFELICYDNLEYVDDDWVKQFYLVIGKLRYFLNFQGKKHNNNRFSLTTLIAK